MVHRIWSLKDLCYTLSFPDLGDSILDTVSLNILDYNPSNIFARLQLVYTRDVGEYSPAKTGEYPRILANF